MFDDNEINGALDDTRPEEEKAKDFRMEELVCAPVVEWKEKTQDEWKKYPIFGQDGSSSCVAQGTCKSLGANNEREEGLFVTLSRRDFYTRRGNFPGLGMIGADAANIAVNFGATLDALMPSEGLGEAAMNVTKDRKPSFEKIGQIYRAKNWVAIPLFDIEAVASVIASGKVPIMFFKFTVAEWDQPVPQILGTYVNSHHCIAGVDFTLYKGKKAIIIDDSWGKNRGLNGQRILTEDWFKKENNRNTWANYFEDLQLIASNELKQPADAAKCYLPTDLSVGVRSDAVAQMQRCLGYLKDAAGYLFPLTQAPTGYFGGITRDAVKRFEAKGELPITGKMAGATRALFNDLFK